MTPAAKRYLLGMDQEAILAVFGITQAELSKQVHKSCEEANPDLYKTLKTNGRKPDIRVLRENAELFK